MEKPKRPIPDWRARCPDCETLVTHGPNGRFTTIYENNARAQGVRSGQLWELPDGTAIRIKDVRVVFSCESVPATSRHPAGPGTHPGLTSPPPRDVEALLRDGRPLLREDGGWR